MGFSCFQGARSLPGDLDNHFQQAPSACVVPTVIGTEGKRPHLRNVQSGAARVPLAGATSGHTRTRRDAPARGFPPGHGLTAWTRGGSNPSGDASIQLISLAFTRRLGNGAARVPLAQSCPIHAATMPSRTVPTYMCEGPLHPPTRAPTSCTDSQKFSAKVQTVPVSRN